MSHLQYNTKSRKGKHLNYEERVKIEALSNHGMKSEQIAKEIGCSGRTVRRELAIKHWINNYPRRLFGGLSSNMLKIHLKVA